MGGVGGPQLSRLDYKRDEPRGEGQQEKRVTEPAANLRDHIAYTSECIQAPCIQAPCIQAPSIQAPSIRAPLKASY